MLLAALAAVTIEVLGLLSLAAIRRLAGDLSPAGVTVILDAVSMIAWFVAGGVGFEVGRVRGAIVAVAGLPCAVGLATVVVLIAGERRSPGARQAELLAFGVALGLSAYAGGRLWESHIRRTRALESVVR